MKFYKNITDETTQKESSLSEVISQLNKTGKRCVFVVDENRRLLGSFSDGDLRRAIVRGVPLDAKVNDYMNTNPLVATDNISRAVAVSMMKTNGLSQIPVVNKDRQIIAIYDWSDNGVAERDNLMVIMAGGEGIRMRPNTENCPKPLLKVAGKPMLEHIINNAKKSGIKKYIIAIRYLGEMIEDHFQTGEHFGVEIEYIREEEKSGTAGALAYIQGELDSPFIVTNGDVITDISYGDVLDFHLQHRAFATIAIRTYEWQNPYGVVQTEGFEVTRLQEKPVYRSYINTGVYVLDPEFIKFVPERAYSDMPNLLDMLLERKKKIIAYPAHENWLDIGNPSELERANTIRRIP